jgi:hypothetical protein
MSSYSLSSKKQEKRKYSKPKTPDQSSKPPAFQY